MPDEKISKVTLAISEDSDHPVRVAVKGVEEELNRLVTDINAKAVFPDVDTGAIAAPGAVSSAGALVAHSATPIPAGGAAGKGILVSSTPNFGLFFGSGAPAISAAKGALYMRSDGTTTNNRMYVNTDGGTTWTAVNTVT
jgi:hypothetical protein